MSKKETELILKKIEAFISISKEEISELILLNYWEEIEKEIEKNDYGYDMKAMLIIDKIFNKNLNIFTHRDLSLKMINYLQNINPNYSSYFITAFINSLLLFYNENKESNNKYFTSYLLDLSLNIFINNNNKNDEQIKFFNLFFEDDFDSLESIILKYMYQINEDNNYKIKNSYIELFSLYMEKLLVKNKFLNLAAIMKQLNQKQFNYFYDYLISFILKNNIFQNIMNDNNKNSNNLYNQFIIINNMIIDYIKENIYDTTEKINLENVENYLLFNLELCVHYNYIKIPLLKFLVNVYDQQRFNSFDYIFPICLYHLSQYISNKDELVFYENLALRKNNHYIYKLLINYKLLLLNKSKKPIQEDFNFELKIINIGANTNNSNYNYSKFIELSHLSLINDLINNSFNEEINNNDNNITLNINYLLKYLSSIENICIHQIKNIKSFFEFFTSFLMELLYLIIDYLAKENNNNIINEINFKELVEIIISLCNDNESNFKMKFIYPMIIQIIKDKLILNYDLFYNRTKSTNEIFDLFITTLIENYTKNEQKSLLIAKLIICVFNNQSKNETLSKLNSINNLVNLYIKSTNNKTSKINEMLLNYILTLISLNHQYYGYYALYIYSEKFEGQMDTLFTDYFYNQFIKFFEGENYKSFLKNNKENIEILLATTCLCNIYKKDKNNDKINKLLDYYVINNKFLNIMEFLITQIKNIQICNNDISISIKENMNILQLWNKYSNKKSLLRFDNYILDKIYTDLKINKNTNSHNLKSYYLSLLRAISELLSEYISTFLSEDYYQDNESNKENAIKENLNHNNSSNVKESISKKSEKKNKNTLSINYTMDNYFLENNVIAKNKTESEFFKRIYLTKKSEFLTKKNIYDSILKHFDYIFTNIFLNIKENKIYSIIINEILSNNKNIKFFFEDFSNIQAYNSLKNEDDDNDNNISINKEINKLTNEFTYEKNILIFNLIYDDIENLNYLFDLCDYIFKRYSKTFTKIYSYAPNLQVRYCIIESIWLNNLIINKNNYVNYLTNIDYISKNNKMSKDKLEKLQSSFIYIFFDRLFDINYIENNQIIYFYCLYSEIFSKYYKSISKLLNFEYILIEYYSIMNTFNCNNNIDGEESSMEELKHNLYKKLFKFLYIFIRMQIPSVYSFYLRILSNESLYNKAFLPNYKYASNIYEIYNDYFFLIRNLINYNSFQIESLDTINKIMTILQNYLLNNSTHNYENNKINNLQIYGIFLENIFNILINYNINDYNNEELFNFNFNTESNQPNKVSSINLQKEIKYKINLKFLHDLIDLFVNNYIPSYLYMINKQFVHYLNNIYNISNDIELENIFEGLNHLSNIINKDKNLFLQKVNSKYEKVHEIIDDIITKNSYIFDKNLTLDLVNKFINSNNQIFANDNDNKNFRAFFYNNLLVFIINRYIKNTNDNKLKDKNEIKLLLKDKIDDKKKYYQAFSYFYIKNKNKIKKDKNIEEFNTANLNSYGGYFQIFCLIGASLINDSFYEKKNL